MFFSFINCLWIIGLYHRTALYQLFNYINGRCFSHVISSWFKSQAPNRKPFPIYITVEVLKYFFKREPNLIFIAVIYGFSSIPILLNAPILFFNSIPLQGIILLSTSIFSLVCLGSGLKQVYMLRNIEAILLILFSGFSTLITL